MPALFLTPFIALGISSCAIDDSNPLVNASDHQAKTMAVNSGSQEEAVPKNVTDDCLNELRKNIPDREMQVAHARRGEASFIVDVKVEGVPNLWRCYHDGTQCTGTEYQGEG